MSQRVNRAQTSGNSPAPATKDKSHDQYATVAMCGSTWLAPLFLTLQAPFTIVFVWLLCVEYDGSLQKFATELNWAHLVEKFPSPTLEALQIIFIFALVAYILLLVVPGQIFKGPISPMGNIPKYTLNGIPVYFITHALFFLGAYQFKLFSPSLVYDRFGEILLTTSLVSIIFCVGLYFKGKYFPTSNDTVIYGSFIFDFFQGTELYPELFGVSLKQFINCRYGMMGWSIVICAFAAKQYELYGYVSNSMFAAVFIQVVYIIKFFYWEDGYFKTIDIMHDRFGFYLCWGCMCWITGIYTLSTLYLVKHPYEMSQMSFILTVVFGVFCVFINYWADQQRQEVRATNGKCVVWGKAPELIQAVYRTGDGQDHKTILLCSGWWGVARHFHYVPEIALSAAWTFPCSFEHVLPWFYVVYLTILLVDRARRDDIRCAAKYTVYWKEYCKKVPYRMVPYLH